MSKQHLTELIQSALQNISAELTFEIPDIQIDVTKDKQHGDFATNIALVLAKQAQRKPRELADLIVKNIPKSNQVQKIEIAGPGFINFFLAPEALSSVVKDILEKESQYGSSQKGQGKKILIEFVSTNPTGPLHVGHGRHAAYGAVLANLLNKIGYSVHREYYVNDAGRQMDILAVSTLLRYLEFLQENLVFPTNAYQGEYMIEIAKDLLKEHSTSFKIPSAKLFQDLPADEPQGGDKEIYIDALIMRAKDLLGTTAFQQIYDFTLTHILKIIRDDLDEFGVSFDTWFSEKELVETGIVDRMFATLNKTDLIYEQEGALWFRSTAFHDEKDRVLQRSNGQRTYFANDLAYHINKFDRGFDLAIDIVGSDHHGYLPRMKAGVQAFGISADKLKYILLQFVSLYRGDVQIGMSTRSGSFVTLRELREEVGNDAARFFYVMRRAEQPVDFDLGLAKSKSNENPVYYIQYAHARICSVFRQMKEKNFEYDENMGLNHLKLLTQAHESKLLTTLSRFSDVIINAAEQYEPHILTNYLRDVATDFHGYYNSEQFLVEDAELRNARLTLIKATRQVLTNGLTLLGVSSPENM